LQTGYLILHLLGIAVGAGAAFTSDFIFLACIQDKKVSKDEFNILESASKAVWLGFILIIFSGIGLFSLDASTLLDSSKFLAKMTIIFIILINGMIFSIKHLPEIKSRIGKPFFGRRKVSKGEYSFLFVGGVISLVSWVYAIILGVFSYLPFSYPIIMSSYLLALIIASLVAYSEAKKFKAKPEAKAVMKAMIIIVVTLLVFSAFEIVTMF
jgi:hypothetical protein